MLLTQRFGSPGQMFLRHVRAWFDHILQCHSSQRVDAGRHRAVVQWRQNIVLARLPVLSCVNARKFKSDQSAVLTLKIRCTQLQQTIQEGRGSLPGHPTLSMASAAEGHKRKVIHALVQMDVLM